MQKEMVFDSKVKAVLLFVFFDEFLIYIFQSRFSYYLMITSDKISIDILFLDYSISIDKEHVVKYY